jgi:two-component system chemotaxis response regulator CheB
VVGLAASAGGPAALDVVLGALPAALPACIGIVQHLPGGFVASFASYLRSRTPLEVVLAEPGAAVEMRAGRIVLAAGDHHLVAASQRLFAASSEPPLRGHRPSATMLFSSLARVFGDRAIGVILTGIGDDGATGLGELHARGALTLGQDQATSAVYGMPSAAVKLGAVSRVLPLPDIPGAIRRAVEGDPR